MSNLVWVKKIPPELNEAILQKSVDMGCRKIAEWLGTEHGIDVSHETVAKLIRTHAKERTVAAKATARAQLGRTVKADIDRLETLVRKTMKMIQKYEDTDPDLFVKLVETARKLLVEKLSRSGVDSPDDNLSELAAAERRVAEKLGIEIISIRESTVEEKLLGPVDDEGEGDD